MKLGVNVDHIATIRQARGGNNPSPIEASKMCLALGADYIVMHLRKDRRHIQETDLESLASFAREKIHLEMACTREMLDFALKLCPNSVCIVPEFPNELTTSGGLNFDDKKIADLQNAIKMLHKKGIKVSLFINPDARSVRTAKRLGAEIVEICTKNYSEAVSKNEIDSCLEAVQMATILAKELELEVHSGHGLNYDNVKPIADITGMSCLNIGFSIISRAVFVGLAQALLEMKLLINEEN